MIVAATAADGVPIAAERFEPPGRPRGTVIVLHEIFGLNDHVRDTARRVASRGFVALVPALFDRVGPRSLSDVSVDDARRGVELRNALGWDVPLGDVVQWIAVASAPVFVLGMSLGGTLAWRCAARFPELAGVVAFSPGNIGDFVDEAPSVPVQIHFAARDPKTPAPLRAAIARRYPDVEIHLHDAEHAFYRPIGDDWNPEAARAADEETRVFVERSLEVPSGKRVGRAVRFD